MRERAYRKQEIASAPTTSILLKPKVFLDQAFLLNLWQKIKGIAAGEGVLEEGEGQHLHHLHPLETEGVPGPGLPAQPIATD